jgi:tungstate transport system ATP-binding protein
MSVSSQTMTKSGSLRACPVTATDLSVVRGGRELLFIPRIELGGVHNSMACTVIVGPNGAGKSVLIRILCALLKPDTGTISWAGSAPDAKRRHKVGLLLQKPVLLKRSASANLVYALRHTGIDRKTSMLRSDQALLEAGLGDIRDVPANRLSGGEQQRLALTRALLLEPEILFLDEPTANVDPPCKPDCSDAQRACDRAQ